jgi:ParB-like chromosome segregation protein Spo0J
MNIKQIDINKLNPATYNPRKDLQPGDAEYEKLKRSIQEFGYVEPVIVNSDFTIISGHQRYKILKDMEPYLEKIDCVVLDVDKTKEKALNIALNKISGEWDQELLKVLLKDLDKDVLELTGFDDAEIERLLNDVETIIDEDTNDEDFERKQIICPSCGYEF